MRCETNFFLSFFFSSKRELSALAWDLRRLDALQLRRFSLPTTFSRRLIRLSMRLPRFLVFVSFVAVSLIVWLSIDIALEMSSTSED